MDANVQWSQVTTGPQIRVVHSRRRTDHRRRRRFRVLVGLAIGGHRLPVHVARGWRTRRGVDEHLKEKVVCLHQTFEVSRRWSS